jgi:excisionase family DNA binding protein
MISKIGTKNAKSNLENPGGKSPMHGRDIEMVLFYTTSEAARILRVSTQTIRNYIYSGKMKSYRTPGGHHRVSKEDLQRLGFLQKKGKGHA